MATYLDNTLSSKRRTGMEVHLNSCPGCQQELSSLKRTWKLLNVAEPMEVPAGFEQKVWRLTQTQPTRILPAKIITRQFFPRWAPMMASAAGIILILTLAIFILRPLSTPIPDQEMVQELELLEDLEIIEVMDMLDYAEDLDYLDEELGGSSEEMEWFELFDDWLDELSEE